MLYINSELIICYNYINSELSGTHGTHVFRLKLCFILLFIKHVNV